MNHERSVYAFIDASNLWAAQKVKGKLFDLKKLKEYLQKRYKTTKVIIFYYDAYPADGTRDYDASATKHKFYTYLKKGLQFEVRKKPLKQIRIANDDGSYNVTEKGNMDVEMTIDAVSRISEYDTAILFSGDSDFLELVTFIKNRGKKVYIFSSRNNISRELRTGGDGYVDVLSIPEDIWRDEVRHRNQRKK